jgi:hypothetical protein
MTDRGRSAPDLYFTFTPARNPFAPHNNPRLFGKDIPVPPHRAYFARSFIARTEVDANDAVEPAEGSGVAPGLGRAGQSLAEVVTFGDRGYVRAEPQIPRPEAANVSITNHIRGVCASGLRPLTPSDFFDIVGEAGGRFRSPCRMKL